MRAPGDLLARGYPSLLFINEEEDLGGWDVDLDLMSAAVPRTLRRPIAGDLEQVCRCWKYAFLSDNPR